jgi:hypothetical protein
VGQDKNTAFQQHSAKLRRWSTIEDLLCEREYWFFQLRESFMRQKLLMKWDHNHLGEYILLPIDYGFVNNEDCYFVSHYWRSQEHPDPDGEDLRSFVEDLADTNWSYIWVDWTCMPQAPRTEDQKRYFKMMLQCIPVLIRDCAFEWRFPNFEPRAWILYEVAEYILTHSRHIMTDDNRPFIHHIWEMVYDGVGAVMEWYRYRCTNEADSLLVTGWLEILVILAKIVPNIGTRQEILDSLNRLYTGSYSNPFLGIDIDKAEGLVRHNGRVYRFTPVFHLTANVSSS